MNRFSKWMMVMVGVIGMSLGMVACDENKDKEATDGQGDRITASSGSEYGKALAKVNNAYAEATKIIEGLNTKADAEAKSDELSKQFKIIVEGRDEVTANASKATPDDADAAKTYGETAGAFGTMIGGLISKNQEVGMVVSKLWADAQK